MNHKTLIKISNTIGVVSIILLVYWIFTFISINVFELKVFQREITETFYMSIFAILALMFGALMINIMFNLSRIAEKHNDDGISDRKKTRKYLVILILIFPLIFGFLFFGDYLTKQQKEKLLNNAAESIITDNKSKIDVLTDYSFEKEWLAESNKILSLLSKTDKNFPRIEVIVKDTFENSNVFLSFDDYKKTTPADTLPPSKLRYIKETTLQEREYLNEVFDNKTKEKRFDANKGYYQLFIPYESNGKTIVLYFSDYQQYGKIGSY